MAITVKHTKVSTIPDGDDSSLIRPSDWNQDHTLIGLGTMAEQDANNVAITGGTISGVSGIGTVTSVAATAGTGISVTGSPITSSGTLTITNTAPDQVVSLTGAGTTSVSGTYPNFTITSTGGSGGGDVIGPASSTDNALTRFDGTTGKVIQNSVVIVDDTGSVTGVNALTAESLTVNNNATLGSSNTDTLDVNARITTDLEPNTNNAKDIGTSGRNWRDGFFGRTLHTVNLALTGTTSFDGSEGTSGQVLTSQGTGNTPTWTTPTTGTVTSVSGTAPIASSGGNTPAISISQATTSTDGYLSSTDWNTFNGKGSGTVTSVAATAGTGISVTGSPITSSGTLTITNTAPDQTVVLTAGTGISTSGTYPSFTVTNTAPDQTVALTAGTGISTSGTYPNFTITNTAPSSGGTVTSITAGTGLSGGTITSSGTIAIDSTVATLTGTQTLTNKTLTSPVLTTASTTGAFTFGGAIDETVFAVTGTTPALSPSNGTIQTWTLSANSTPTAGTWNAGESMTMMINDSASAFTITWTTIGVTWVGGTAPTLATTGYTVIELWKVGSTIYGALVGQVA